MISKIKSTTNQYIEDLFGLLYPKLCPACGDHLPLKNQKLCFTCDAAIPLTNYHLLDENPVTEKFAGRVKIEKGGALFKFTKEGRVQKVIHQLKYQNKPEIGVNLGEMYGREVQENNPFQSVDMIIPVPLHPKKEKKRGYNQSDMIAQGLSKSLGKPWKRNILIRSEYTTTQTKKSNVERFANVENAFVINNSKLIENKHILLVDDVLTTGATFEACILKLQEVKNVKVSVMVLGFAEH